VIGSNGLLLAVSHLSVVIFMFMGGALEILSKPLQGEK
jgi:hypothetical protein